MSAPIVLILQTYQRTDYALRTIDAAQRLLGYDGELVWYVADDGSDEAHVARVLAACGPTCGWHSARRGYGPNANAAWDAATQVSPLTFWLEDDWELAAPLDLTPYARLLADEPAIGMVRLGYLNPGITGHTRAAGGRLYWALHHEPIESWQCVFTGHPSLRHARYRAAYGDYEGGLTPGDTELAYAYRYRTHDGPWIVWPADYPTAGLLHHIGTVRTEALA